MSSILPFVVVAASLAIVASVALGEAPQPATTEDGVRRDPWTKRLWALLRRIVRGIQAAWSALLGRVRRMAEARRERRAARAADRPPPAATATASAEISTGDAPPVPSGSPTTVARPSSAPDGVLTTALMVPPDPALGEVAGERMTRAAPSLITRLRSALGLAALILVLGLALAAVLGVIIAIAGGAIDGFVN